ncbi:PREDICTED: uncharacterized protein LOC108772362 [Cyphomyrmex costatus]|uniref:uncharacterized protein LOC108772362 n=1 Tax=Cyphomyrmex costatus TaxID=456900 RepID=UPI0008523FFD|nr:PREDICTED: uncharacterized protein LOC108772362 [Cyphomyrmex costatus]
MLIGAQLFWQLICVGQIKACKAHPTIHKTKLGWVISAVSHNNSSNVAMAACHLTAVDKLNESISKFWKIENDFSLPNTTYTTNKQICETHFQQNTRRNVEGRFVVKLPTNNEKLSQLGESKGIARGRFFNLDRRLLAQPAVYTKYKDFMREYIDLGHMREVKDHLNEQALSICRIMQI